MVNTTPLLGYEVGCTVSGWVLIIEASNRDATTGSKYVRWYGFDYCGNRVTGTLFQNTPGDPIPHLDLNRVYAITATVGSSKSGGFDLWAKSMVEVTDPVDIDEFKSHCYPTLPKDVLDKTISQLEQYATVTIQDPGIRKLSELMFSFMRPYLGTRPAGMRNHDTMRGGLAKHTLEVVRIVFNKLLYEKGLDTDVLIFSALYHDIGKCFAYDEDTKITTLGNLVPHAITSLCILEENISSMGDIVIAPERLMNIRHCIASHHGEHSERGPLTREAVAVHFADNMVSTIAHIEGFIENMKLSDSGTSTEYSGWLKGYPYVPQRDATSGGIL